MVLSVPEGPGAGLRAVGLGSNVKKRTRAGRVALAIALELNERSSATPELEVAVRVAARAVAAASAAAARGASSFGGGCSGYGASAAGEHGGSGGHGASGHSYGAGECGGRSSSGTGGLGGALSGMGGGAIASDATGGCRRGSAANWLQPESPPPPLPCRDAPPHHGPPPPPPGPSPKVQAQAAAQRAAASAAEGVWPPPYARIEPDPSAPPECVDDPVAVMRPWCDGPNGKIYSWPYCKACQCWTDLPHLYGQRHQRALRTAEWSQPEPAGGQAMCTWDTAPGGAPRRPVQPQSARPWDWPGGAGGLGGSATAGGLTAGALPREAGAGGPQREAELPRGPPPGGEQPPAPRAAGPAREWLRGPGAGGPQEDVPPPPPGGPQREHCHGPPPPPPRPSAAPGALGREGPAPPRERPGGHAGARAAPAAPGRDPPCGRGPSRGRGDAVASAPPPREGAPAARGAPMPLADEVPDCRWRMVEAMRLQPEPDELVTYGVGQVRVSTPWTAPSAASRSHEGLIEV